jgi:hypothetical protein
MFSMKIIKNFFNILNTILLSRMEIHPQKVLRHVDAKVNIQKENQGHITE